MDAEKKSELVKANDKELQNWLNNSAVEAATRSGLSSRTLMRMRWVITEKPTGLNARLAVQGFALGASTTGVSYGQPPSTTVLLRVERVLGPPHSQGGRDQRIPAGRRERARSRRVPVKQLAAALGIPSGAAGRLRRAVYGLVNAPRQCWADVRAKMATLGYGWRE